MALLKSSRDVPPGGWKYVERETGQRFESDDYDHLVATVRRHREYKNLPVDDLDNLIQSQICLGLTTEECRPLPGEDYRPVSNLTQRLTADMAASANKAFFEFAKGGFHFVDKAEADRRAAICRNCPFNTPASGCSCHGIYRTIEFLIPSARRQPGLSVCMCCGCSLQAKVNMPDDVVRASLSPEVSLPPWCWQQGLK
jgi:hypothetical protein